MKLLELHIDGFGKFHDRTISFEDGINVVYGNNEAGKSTLHTFIRGMLFGIERGRGRAAKNDTYSKFEPWENSGTYEGWMRLEKDGTIYRIERRFRKDSKSLKIINETLGREEEPAKPFLDSILGALNETTYNNTISIGQLKSATEEGMIGELKNYIANMNTTGNISLNITKATSFLRSQKRTLEADLIPDASREYTALLTEIRTVEAEIAGPQFENQLSSYQNMRSQVKHIIEGTQVEKSSLDGKIADSKKILEDNHFTDKNSVESYKKRAEDHYQTYLNAKAECGKKSRGIIRILAVLLAAVCAACAAHLEISYRGQYTPVVAICFTATLIWLLLSFSLNRRIHRDQKTMQENHDQLAAMLKEILQNDTISEESMVAFRQKMADFSTLCDMVQQSEAEAKKLMEEINTLRERQNNCSEMIEQQQRTQWELEKKLEHLNHCKTKAETLKHVLAENDRIREEVTAIDLAQETMTHLSSSIRDSFGLYLNKEASRLVNGITGGIYDSMSIDENLNVFLNTKRKLVPIDQVSSGTMDQVYLALRLAAAKLLQSDGELFPLIFDDSFTQYDDERLRTALKWLADTYHGQIIIFTCHRREAQMLRAHQVDFHYTEI